ncbi:MAG: aldehyde dehydrogenase family protein, partial [Nitrososphaerales archaeon]
MKLKTINPATEEVLAEYEIMSREQVDERTSKSQIAFQAWKNDARNRAGFLYAFADELRKNKENLARTASNEMGKAIKEARSEIEKCAWTMEFFADNGTVFAHDEVV